MFESVNRLTHGRQLQSHPISSPGALGYGELINLTIICDCCLISKFQVGLKSLLCQGLSEPKFYGDLVYKLEKNVGSHTFSVQFIKNNFSLLKDWL